MSFLKHAIPKRILELLRGGKGSEEPWCTLCDDQNLPLLLRVQVIAIDEGQFFIDLHEFCTAAANEDHKKVIVAGLNGDFRREKFGQVVLASRSAFCAHALSTLPVHGCSSQNKIQVQQGLRVPSPLGG